MHSVKAVKTARVVFPPRSEEAGIPNLPSTFVDVDALDDFREKIYRKEFAGLWSCEYKHPK